MGPRTWVAAAVTLALGALLAPLGSAAEKAQENRRPHPGAGTRTKPVGWVALRSGQAAKLVRRSSWEPRPQNFSANHTVPTVAQLAAWRAQSTMPYARRVDGRYMGTTDEIIQWAAYKWGLDPNILRAVAVVESWWRQDTVGDNGDSFGIFQVRRPFHCFGDCAIVRSSTAFTADYYGGIIRAYLNGKEGWLNSPDVAPQNGAPYRAGDLWSSIGAWFSGRWHTPASEAYVAKVEQRLAEHTWRQPYFVGH